MLTEAREWLGGYVHPNIKLKRQEAIAVGTIGVAGFISAVTGGARILSQKLSSEPSGKEPTWQPQYRDPKPGEFGTESENLAPETVEQQPVWRCGEGGPKKVIEVTINSRDWDTFNSEFPEVRTASAAQRLAGSTSSEICHIPNDTEWGHTHNGLNGLDLVFNGEKLQFEAPVPPTPNPIPSPTPEATRDIEGEKVRVKFNSAKALDQSLVRTRR